MQFADSAKRNGQNLRSSVRGTFYIYTFSKDVFLSFRYLSSHGFASRRLQRERPAWIVFHEIHMDGSEEKYETQGYALSGG